MVTSTNSFHLDVQKKVNPYDKIADFEMPYPEISSGGFICYGEISRTCRRTSKCRKTYGITATHVFSYYGTNTPIDECLRNVLQRYEFDCTSKGFTCPKCGNHDST
ncbi:hypothetical protein O9929_25250 [Vibrio lentus]|nr:hypothetical protein [Vibrio lentus]